MKIKNILFVLAAPFAIGSAIASGPESNTMAYQITMHNQTNAQWFSPYLCALHHRRVSLVEFGLSASTGQATFAEDGFNGVLAEELRSNPDVYAVLQTGAGLTPPNSSRVETIEGYAPRNARLTCAAMPVTTNDVLTAVSNVRLPRRVNRTRVYLATDWDLGSEANNYSADYMPLDSVNLAPESEENPVIISENVVFGPEGRPSGVPSILNFFTRSFTDGGQITAESYMGTFQYRGSEEFPADTYGWLGSASRFEVTRIR